MRQSSNRRAVRWLGTWPVLAALTVAVLVSGLFAALKIRHQITERVQNEAVITSGLVQSLTVNRKPAEEGDKLAEVSAAVRAEIDADVEELQGEHMNWV